MKLLSLLALTFVCMNSANAESAAVSRCGAAKFTGFFGGVNLGLSSITTKQSANVAVNAEDAATDTKKATTRQGGIGPQFGVHAGYGYGYGNFGYVAGQLYGNYTNINVGYNDADHSLKTKYNFGMGVKAGASLSAISNTVYGVMLNLEWQRFQYKGMTVSTGEETALKKLNKKFTKFGIRPGLFVQTLVGQNMFVGFNATCGMFGKIKASGQTLDKNVTDLKAAVEVSYKF